MKRFFQLRVMIYLLFAVSVGFSSGQNEERPLTNDDVIKMIKANLPESTIVLTIKQVQSSRFDTSPDALIKLKEEGAGTKILEAIVVAGKRSTDGSNTSRLETGITNLPKSTAEDVVGYFSVSIVDGPEKRTMKWVPFNSKTYSAKTMIPYAGLFFKKDTYNKIPGKNSDFKVLNRSPEFELTIMSGVQAAAVVQLVKLEQTGTDRKIMVSQQGKFRSTSGIRSKDIVPSTITEIRSSPASGFSLYSLKPNSTLKQGEYAIVVNGTQFYDFSVPLLP